MTWTAARGHERCANCGHALEKDEPMALLTSRNLKRCAPCVSPSPVDWDMVHLIIEARKEIATGEPVTNIRQAFGRLGDSDFHSVLQQGGGILGRKRPKPYAAVADDPKVQRSGGEW